MLKSQQEIVIREEEDEEEDFENENRQVNNYTINDRNMMLTEN